MFLIVILFSINPLDLPPIVVVIIIIIIVDLNCFTPIDDDVSM